MLLGTGTRFWKFEAAITRNIITNGRARGIQPTLSQRLYSSLARALAEDRQELVKTQLLILQVELRDILEAL